MSEDFADSILRGVQAIHEARQSRVVNEQRQQQLDQQAQIHTDLVKQTKQQMDYAQKNLEYQHQQQMAQHGMDQLKVLSLVGDRDTALKLGGELSKSPSNADISVNGFSAQAPAPVAMPQAQVATNPAQLQQQVAQRMQYIQQQQLAAKQALQPTVDTVEPVAKQWDMPAALNTPEGATRTMMLPTAAGDILAANRASAAKQIIDAPMNEAKLKAIAAKDKDIADKAELDRATKESEGQANRDSRESMAADRNANMLALRAMIKSNTKNSSKIMGIMGGKVVELHPGDNAEGFQTPSAISAMNSPTTQMHNVYAQASLVHEQVPSLISSINSLKDELGPVQGRWNEFMQGKLGTDNPKFAGLRTDLLFMSSAVALMHARGRLPENLRHEFDMAINAPQQDFKNLVTALNHVDDWTTKNMNAMKGPGSNTATPSSSSGDVHWVTDSKGKLVRSN